MQLSARNQLKGKVQSVEHGAVNSEVVIELPGGAVVVSIITRSSAERLGLAPGNDAYAVVKASDVMVAVSETAFVSVGLQIAEFSNAFADDAIELVVGIQRDEFGFPVSAEQQPDLLDVAAHYRNGAGNFWVALEDGRLVGTIGLLDLGGGRASLRKMFVRPEQRGSGAARRLLEELLGWARARAFAAIFLGTTSRYHAAHRFYEKHGFARIGAEDLPEGFPRFDIEDRFYRLDLR